MSNHHIILEEDYPEETKKKTKSSSTSSEQSQRSDESINEENENLNYTLQEYDTAVIDDNECPEHRKTTSSSSSEGEGKKEKKKKKNIFQKVGGGMLKGTKALGHGLVKGTKAVGHGVVKGTKAVGHGVSGLFKSENDKEKEKEKENSTTEDKEKEKEKEKEIKKEKNKDNDKEKEKDKSKNLEDEIKVSKSLKESKSSKETKSLKESKSKKESKESKESAETPELKIKKLKKTNEGIETNESQSSQSEVGCEVKSQTSETSQTSQTSQNSLSSSRSKKLFKRKRTASMMVESSSPGLSVENIYKEAPPSTSVKESNLSSSSSTSPNNVKETKTLGSSQRASPFQRGNQKQRIGSLFKSMTFKDKEDVKKRVEDEEFFMKLYKENITCFDNPSEAEYSCESCSEYKCIDKSSISKDELLFALCKSISLDIDVKVDCWSSMKMPIDKFKIEEDEKQSLVPFAVKKDGFAVEMNENSIEMISTLKNSIILDVDSDFAFYKRFFYQNEKVKHYLSKEENVIVSIEKFDKIARCILRNNKGIFRCIIGEKEADKPEKYKQFFNEPKSVCQIDNSNKQLDEALLEVETKSIIRSYKFGVIYVKPNQHDENGIFNNKEEECSPAFWKFMNLLGEKIQLMGWQNYRGGLDVKKGSTGTHSYFTQSNKFEIMFHVSPLLPILPNDEQALERKRHVGNDVVVLIFKEQADENDKFDVRLLTSHFNSIFIVVSPEKTTEDNEKYHVTVCCVPNIDPFGPYLNETAIYEHDDKFRDFLLRKMINGERQAMLSPTFKKNHQRTIQSQLKSLNDQFFNQSFLSHIF